MSYCRWSSDNWDSDVYCYEDVSGGYTTHVAGNRITSPVTPLDMANIDTSYKQQAKDLKDCTRGDIGLPYDGESYNDSTLEEFRDRLLLLKQAGYHVPDFVFETIEDEIKDLG